MADDWSAFPEVADPSPKPSKRKRGGFIGGRGPIAPHTVLTAPVATDGDTIRAQQGVIRLAGVDAPESKQLGYDRGGNPVPIGQQSRQALLDYLGRGFATTGPTFGQSYGRTVAPVTVGSDDAGFRQVRLGDALAAPEYLGSDPTRAKLYNEGERLARMNGLGMHDKFVPQTPSEYRHEGAYVPDRDTVAQFFDTPTPLQGLPADKEAQLRQLYATGSAAEINGFLKANGYETTRPADLAEFIRQRDKGAKADPSVTYQAAPPLMIDAGDGAGGAAVRKGASGFLAGGLDELGAVVDTLGGTGGRENIFNSDRRVADIWANNQRQNAGILAYDQTAHPTASTAAEVAGGLLGGFAIPYGQGARTIPELAKVGAVFGGATGFLGTDGNVADRSLGAVKGTLTGALATPVLGKALEVGTPALVAAARKLAGKDAPEAARAAAGGVGARVAPDGAPAAPVSATANDNAEAGLASIREGFTARNALDVEVLDRLSATERAALDMPRQEGEPLFAYHARRGRAMVEAHADNLRYLEALKADGIDGLDAHIGISQRALADSRADLSRVAERALKDAPPSMAAGNSGDEWAGFPVVADDAAPSAMPMDAAPGDSLSAPAPRPRDYLDLTPAPRPRPLGDDYTTAERLAAAERVGPRDVLPMPGNTVTSADEAAAIEAGRYGPAKAPNEREYLDRVTMPGLNGPVPKVGPVDMVGWLRTSGGLKPDPGGELANMGLTNAARRGLDHVGQETRFGPLIDDQGMNLDDAALAAWEAGYFPEHSDRPSINDFLDALRDTYDGNMGRRFRAEDQGQLEAFNSARNERLDLQRMEADGPVSVDRSQPVGPEVPFAPPEAYDDASREAIRRVGNIDVSKLESPQDIARALKVSSDALGGFDAATRGRISQAETERLASDLGMTADQLLARRKGQAFNAEEALAARQILAKSGNELVNAARAISKRDDPGEELLAEFRRKLVRHQAIQEQVSGMTAEAGRALQQFRQVAESRAVRTDVINSIVSGGGGRKSLKNAADALLDMVETDPGKFNLMAEKLAKPKWRDKAAELYVNFLLSWPQTHAVNIVSNTLTAMAQPAEYAVGSAIGGARRLVMGDKAKDRILASEVGARTFGLLQGAREGARMFVQSVKSGEASDMVSKVEGQQFKAISGLKGEVVRTPTRMLTAEDEFFKGIARRMELNAEAVRLAHKEGLTGQEASDRIAELVTNPTDEMLSRSMDYARYLTFQRKLGPVAQPISAATGQSLILKSFMPFVRTPTNLLKFAAERSPAAAFLPEWQADFLAGGERRDMAIARMMVGTGLGLAVYEAAQAGHITGSAPSDPKRARLLYADGWKPYSVKLGGTFYSYKRLDPFSTTIGVAADLALISQGMTEKQREDKTTLLVASIMGNLSDKTWLSGVSDVISALHEPERYAGDFKNRLITSFLIPNLVGGTARTLDPTARRAETFGEEVQSRIPGLRDDLLPRRDVWGRPIVNQGGVGPDFLSPVWVSQQLDDPVNHELMQLDYAPGVPSKTVGGRELPPAEYDHYLELAGKGSYSALSSLVRSPEWKALDDEGKVKAARKAVADARRDARAKLGGGSGPAANDPWSAFPEAEARKIGANTGGLDPWAAFPTADKRDVQAELSAAIPGVQFTSGYRDPAYNASLRARGYHPATNSEHLDGAALDMLPPPGKSLAWLARQVRNYDPKARLLVHDGHLHGGFDGYNSAPKLGGMAGR